MNAKTDNKVREVIAAAMKRGGLHAQASSSTSEVLPEIMKSVQTLPDKIESHKNLHGPHDSDWYPVTDNDTMMKMIDALHQQTQAQCSAVHALATSLAMLERKIEQWEATNFLPEIMEHLPLMVPQTPDEEDMGPMEDGLVDLPRQGTDVVELQGDSDMAERLQSAPEQEREELTQEHPEERGQHVQLVPPRQLREEVSVRTEGSQILQRMHERSSLSQSSRALRPFATSNRVPSSGARALMTLNVSSLDRRLEFSALSWRGYSRSFGGACGEPSTEVYISACVETGL